MAYQDMGSTSLGISIVTFKPDLAKLADTLRSLELAAEILHDRHKTGIKLWVIDNGGELEILEGFIRNLSPLLQAEILCTHENLGYGKAHNLALLKSPAAYHLILNPDVVLDENALLRGIEYLQENQSVAALSPDACDGDSKKLFLCKSYPAVTDLLLRGLDWKILKNWFDARLARYEKRAVIARGEAAEVELISGCFILAQTEKLQKIGGFNEAFFLYFEDFSLSLELQKYGKLVYYPDCKIIHHGGNAAKKGFKHIRYFVESGLRFYQLYGWKFF